jgi:hypothetical protein
MNQNWSARRRLPRSWVSTRPTSEWWQASRPYDRIKATTLWRTKEVRALALERGRTEEEIAAVMERLHLELLTTRVRRNKPSTTTEETEKVA